jgi:hypothetical protein
MSRIWITIFIVLLHATPGALALERIKKKPPTSAEAERIASDMAMADSSLQKGSLAPIEDFSSTAALARTDTPTSLRSWQILSQN